MKTTNAVAVKAIIGREGRILLLRRSIESSYRPDIWEFPGGKTEPGEDYSKALTREVKEETNLSIVKVHQHYISTFFRAPKLETTLITYLCTCDPAEVILSSEHHDFHWATLAELESYLPPDVYQGFLLNKHLIDLELAGIK